ncbi:MAG: DUF465 domain-containing protein [Nitrospinota bacterium]
MGGGPDALSARALGEDPEYRQLLEEHQGLERRLAELESIRYPSTEQALEIKALKKKKLIAKDRMALLQRRFLEATSGGAPSSRPS